MKNFNWTALILVAGMVGCIAFDHPGGGGPIVALLILVVGGLSGAFTR